MATLEIHDSEGHVEYRTIQQDRQTLIGSDPGCDIVLLNDPSIMPIHGRIRWRNGRYKVEATPEGRSIEVDGKKVLSSSFRQGAELRLGSYRIFFVTPDDGPANFEKTKVQGRPETGKPAGLAGAFGGEVAPPSVETPFDELEQALSFGGLVQESTSSSDPDQESPSRSGSPSGQGRTSRDRSANAPKFSFGAIPGMIGRGITSVIVGRDQAPGEERVVSSPVVIGLVLAIVLLVGAGFALFGIISQIAAGRSFANAEQAFREGNYQDAIDQFDAYLESYPAHLSVNDARVMSGLAGIRRFTTGNSAYANALEEAAAMSSTFASNPSFEKYRDELADTVLEIAEGLTADALRTAEAEPLSLAQRAVNLHDEIAGDNAEAIRTNARFPLRLEAARAAVVKAQIRSDALSDMDRALSAGDPETTYDARDLLVLRYADLATDAEVLDRIDQANELIRSKVSVDLTSREASATPVADRLGPPTSLVLRSQDDPPDPNSPVVFALADGHAYALDGTNGAPLWHVPVGLDSPFSPIAIPGAQGDVLVVDAIHDDLIRLEGRTGRLLWRQGLGEPVRDRPLILGNQIAQPTPGGRLLLIDLIRGRLQAAVDFGQPIAQAPITDPLGERFYTTGFKDVVFIVTRDPLECVSVQYTGHPAGSILCPPARLDRYFVLPENHLPEAGQWSIFVIDEEGLKLTLRQRVPIQGWTWDTPEASGQIAWSVADRGAIVAYSVGPYDVAEPFKQLAEVKAEGDRLGPSFGQARTDRELWVNSGRSARYELNAEAGTLSQRWTLAQAGPAIAPPQVLGPPQMSQPLLVLTQAPETGSGASLWGIEPRGGRVLWRTVLGAAWPDEPLPGSDGESLESLTEMGDRLILPTDQLAEGGFVTQSLPKPGERRLPIGRLNRFEIPGATVIVPSRNADHLFVRPSDSTSFTQVDLPAPLAASPLIWNDAMLVPAVDGRAYLIDPITGAPAADPLLSSFDRDDPILWLDPVLMDENAVALAERDGTIRRLILDTTDRPRLVVSAEVKLNSPPVSPPASTGDTLIVATADLRLRILAARDLSAAGAAQLDAPVTQGPAGDLETGIVLVLDAAGTIIAYGPGGQRLWTVPLDDAPAAGRPKITGNDLWLLTIDGTLHHRSLSDGTIIQRIETATIPAGGPTLLGDSLAIPVSPGTIRLLDVETAANAAAE